MELPDDLHRRDPEASLKLRLIAAAWRRATCTPLVAGTLPRRQKRRPADRPAASTTPSDIALNLGRCRAERRSARAHFYGHLQRRCDQSFPRAADLLAEAGLKPGADGLPDAHCSGCESVSIRCPRRMWQAQLRRRDLKLDIVAKFLRYGFVILHSVPTADQSAVPGRPRASASCATPNFGRHFNVRSIPNANDLAYSSLALDPHTDNPYREPAPGIQLLHCLTNQTSRRAVDAGRRFCLRRGLASAGPRAPIDLLTQIAKPLPLPGCRCRTCRLGAACEAR